MYFLPPLDGHATRYARDPGIIAKLYRSGEYQSVLGSGSGSIHSTLTVLGDEILALRKENIPSLRSWDDLEQPICGNWGDATSPPGSMFFSLSSLLNYANQLQCSADALISPEIRIIFDTLKFHPDKTFVIVSDLINSTPGSNFTGADLNRLSESLVEIRMHFQDQIACSSEDMLMVDRADMLFREQLNVAKLGVMCPED